MYKYKLSKQGISYLKYLANREKYESENWSKATLEAAVLKNLEKYVNATSTEPYRTYKKLILRILSKKKNPRFRKKLEIVSKILEIKERQLANNERIKELERKLEEERKLREQAIRERDEAYKLIAELAIMLSTIREYLTKQNI